MASLDKEQADLEKALATSADEHAKLVAAKQAQELLLVEQLMTGDSESKFFYQVY